MRLLLVSGREFHLREWCWYYWESKGTPPAIPTNPPQDITGRKLRGYLCNPSLSLNNPRSEGRLCFFTSSPWSLLGTSYHSHLPAGPCKRLPSPAQGAIPTNFSTGHGFLWHISLHPNEPLKKSSYLPLYWLFNRYLYTVIVYYNPNIPGKSIYPTHPKQPKFFIAQMNTLKSCVEQTFKVSPSFTLNTNLAGAFVATQ